ncbi:MAG: hypothetical protein ACOCPM_06945 [Bacteroidales bacterium]
MNFESQILSTVNKFNKSKIKFALTPIESVPSLPVPQIIKKRAYLSFFFFIGKRLDKNEKIKLFRPIIKFIVDANTASIVSYVNYSVIDEFPGLSWQEPIGEFPHDSISGMSLREYQEQKNKLIQKYDDIIENILSGSNNEKLWKEFSEQFYKICEPALLPFMEQISPAFFGILNEFKV